jgi:hypothetical protein
MDFFEGAVGDHLGDILNPYFLRVRSGKGG